MPVSVCQFVPLSFPHDNVCPRYYSGKIVQNFLTFSWDILCVNISDKWDHGYLYSLNVCIIDQKMLLIFFFAWLKSLFKLEQWN